MVDKATAQLGGEGRGTSPQREHTHEKHTREHRDAGRPNTPEFQAKGTPVTQRDTRRKHTRQRQEGHQQHDARPRPSQHTQGRETEPMEESPHNKGKPDHRGTGERGETPRRGEGNNNNDCSKYIKHLGLLYVHITQLNIDSYDNKKYYVCYYSVNLCICKIRCK